jgi:shikimate 5-dehydrogenase
MNCELKAFKKIVVFGSGGVCLALLDYIGRFFDEGPEVVVCRRSAHRDSELKQFVSDRFKLRFANLTVDNADAELAGRAGETLWLQATSAPLYGNDLGEYARIVKSFDGVFVDLVYGSPSRIYHAAQLKGLLCQDGLPMLIEQARAAEIIWWGRAPALEDFQSILI